MSSVNNTGLTVRMSREYPRLSDALHISLDAELFLKAVSAPDIFLQRRLQLDEGFDLYTQLDLADVVSVSCLSVII